MMLVFLDLRSGVRAEFEQIFRGCSRYTQLGRAKSNPILDTGFGYVFRGADRSTYLGKNGEVKLAGTSAHIEVSDSFPKKPLKLSFKVYLVR